MNLEVTNLVAVFVAALIPLVVGMVWYARPVFGRLWLMHEQVTPEESEQMHAQNMWPKMAAAYAGNVLMAYMLAVLINFLVVGTPIAALKLGAVVWIGFMFPVALTRVLWDPRKKTVGYLAINSGFFLVSVLLMSVVLVLWI